MGFHVLSKDQIDNPISIDGYLVRDRVSSFLMHVSGDAMKKSAICNGDLVLVETSLPARDGVIVVACSNGEFILRRYILKAGKPWLVSEHPNHRPIQLQDGDDFTLFGVVTAVIRKLKV